MYYIHDYLINMQFTLLLIFIVVSYGCNPPSPTLKSIRKRKWVKMLCVDEKLTCPIGSEPHKKLSYCVKCKKGYIKNSINLLECDSCPAGSFINERGSLKCKICPEGTSQPNEGRGICVKNYWGQYSGKGAINPSGKKCPSFKYTTSVISKSSCIGCKPEWVIPGVINIILTLTLIKSGLQCAYSKCNKNPNFLVLIAMISIFTLFLVYLFIISMALTLLCIQGHFAPFGMEPNDGMIVVSYIYSTIYILYLLSHIISKIRIKNKKKNNCIVPMNNDVNIVV